MGRAGRLIVTVLPLSFSAPDSDDWAILGTPPGHNSEDPVRARLSLHTERSITCSDLLSYARASQFMLKWEGNAKSLESYTSKS
ncbi:unnamed protein product [Protopolystoma xenopodis]|uniref:Uncharacterized protein n=1 Tax=Protopolystoma xenopodis TaxID=117903 RepID=A0A448WQ15_9PLAT|nr:unnamed protein product [Protopolystoma xenopodis]